MLNEVKRRLTLLYFNEPVSSFRSRNVLTVLMLTLWVVYQRVPVQGDSIGILIHSFSQSSVRPSVRLFIHPSNQIHPSIRPSVPPFVRSFVRLSFVCSSVFHSFIHLPNRSSSQLSSRSFVHSFGVCVSALVCLIVRLCLLHTLV